MSILPRPGDSRHLYEQAAAIIKDRILSGHYSPGQELPSMAKVGEEFGIGELTIQRAFYKLRDEGWLIVRHGHNTRIANELPSANAKDQLLEQAKRALDEVTKLVQAIEAVG
jgi:DNA-binding transcriptional regulator YhcF (GntR family)